MFCFRNKQTPASKYFKIYSVFKNNFGFFFHHFFDFFKLQKRNPPGQGEVSQGSRRSASGVKEKCAGVQEKVCQGQGEVLQLNTTPSVEALLLDPRCTSP